MPERQDIMRIKPVIFIICSFLIVLASCKPEQEKPYQPTPYELQKPAYFPSATNIPSDNPMTEEGVALGRKLFYDPRLSGRDGTDGIRSCASCHHQENNFDFGGSVGLHHSVMPLVNLAWNTTGLGWNGGVTTLEDMVLAAVTSPAEINADTNQVVRYLQKTDDYPKLFEKAFGSRDITFLNIQRAIAQFVRSLVSSDSKFDRYLRGEEQLTQDELEGYLLFVTEDGADCFHCHGGGGNALMPTNLFYNNGLADDFNDPAPYMHDGRFQTLDEVIDFYSDSVKNSATISPLMHHVMQGGVRLTPQEKSQLKAFLNTLTDEAFLNNPKHAAP